MNAGTLRLLLIGGFLVAIYFAGKRMLSGVKNLIAGEEGLKLTAYQDTGGEWTIGYGHLIQPGERYHPYGPVRTITQAEADALFDHDTRIATAAVDQLVRVPLTTSQRDALISFVFNVGVNAFRTSTLLRKLNAGDYAGAAAEFPRWNRDNGAVVAGLTERRLREQALFNA